LPISERRLDVLIATIRIIAAAVAMVALAGCDGTSGPQGTPGTATVSLHGQVEAGVGASWR
jgi:hypothetical protein